MNGIYLHSNKVRLKPYDKKSIILDNGICIVGDLEPIEYLEAYGKNISLENDWNCVMSHNPKIIYYSHVNEKVL